MDKEIFSIIEKCPNEIKNRMINKKYSKNEIIIEQDCDTDYLYILVRGKVQIYIVSESDIKYLQKIFEAPCIFGEVEIMDSKPYMCYVEALADCEVLKVPQKVYIDWLKADYKFSLFIIQSLCNKLYYKTKKTSRDVFYSLEYRVINLVLDLCKEGKSDCIKVNKRLFAEEFATSVRSVNRILKKLEEQKEIKYGKSGTIICDVEKLEERIKLKR